MKTRTTVLIWSALAVGWGAGAALYVYPDVQEEIEEKRYLHAVEKQHLHVLSMDCARARGVENRDFIREDTDPTQCWLTIPAFNALYPEIAGATDIGATLRSQEREELPLDHWDGTPVGAVALAAAQVIGPPLLGLLFLRYRRSRSTRRSRGGVRDL